MAARLSPDTDAVARAVPVGRSTPEDALFEFEAVEIVRGGRRLLHLEHLTVAATGITAVIGPSGSGKSTLLRLCNRLEVPDGGTVRFRGHDLADLDPLRLRRRVGMVFQRPTLFGGTVRDNLRIAAPEADTAAFVDALGRAGLAPELLDRPAAVLSGGEGQRACIARTLLTAPEALLFDEPTSALDGVARQRIEVLGTALASSGIPLLWVTHDLEQLRRVADHVVVVESGRLVYQGSAVDLDRDRGLLARLNGEGREHGR